MTQNRWGFLIAVFIGIGAQGVVGQPVDLPTGASASILAPADTSIYELPIGKFSASDKPTRLVEGRITRSAYRVPLDQNNSFGVFSSLRDALQAKGYAVLFQCSDSMCGGFDFRYGIDILKRTTSRFNITRSISKTTTTMADCNN